MVDAYGERHLATMALLDLRDWLCALTANTAQQRTRSILWTFLFWFSACGYSASVDGHEPLLPDGAEGLAPELLCDSVIDTCARDDLLGCFSYRSSQPEAIIWSKCKLTLTRLIWILQWSLLPIHALPNTPCRACSEVQTMHATEAILIKQQSLHLCLRLFFIVNRGFFYASLDFMS